MENQNQECLSHTTDSTKTCITYTLDEVIDYEPDIFDEIQAAVDQANLYNNHHECESMSFGDQHISMTLSAEISSETQYLKNFFTVVALLWLTIVIFYVLSRIVSRSRVWKNIALKWKRSKPSAQPNPSTKQYQK